MSIINIQTCFAPGKERWEERDIHSPFVTGIIDPDWPYTEGPKKGRHGYTRFRDNPERNQYREKIPLSIEELAALPIGELVGGYLLMWTVSPFLIGGRKKQQGSAALYLLEKWGFVPCSMLTWVKYRLDRIAAGEPSGGYGGVGFWYINGPEHIIVAKKPEMPSIRTGMPGFFIEPKGKHSVKPKNLHNHVESRFPGPLVEIFGRYGIQNISSGEIKETFDFGPEPKNWTVLGSQTPSDGTDIRESIGKHIRQ